MSSIYFTISALFCIIIILILFYQKERISTVETKLYGFMIISSFVDVILVIAELLLTLYHYNDITEKIEERVKEKQILFEGYAPEQSDLLKNYALSCKDGFIFYCVSQNATDAMIYFLESLK